MLRKKPAAASASPAKRQYAPNAAAGPSSNTVCHAAQLAVVDDGLLVASLQQQTTHRMPFERMKHNVIDELDWKQAE